MNQEMYVHVQSVSDTHLLTDTSFVAPEHVFS